MSAAISRYRAGEPIRSIAADHGVPEDEIAEAIYAIRPTAAAA